MSNLSLNNLEFKGLCGSGLCVIETRILFTLEDGHTPLEIFLNLKLLKIFCYHSTLNCSEWHASTVSVGTGRRTSGCKDYGPGCLCIFLVLWDL